MWTLVYKPLPPWTSLSINMGIIMGVLGFMDVYGWYTELNTHIYIYTYISTINIHWCHRIQPLFSGERELDWGASWVSQGSTPTAQPCASWRIGAAATKGCECWSWGRGQAEPGLGPVLGWNGPGNWDGYICIRIYWDGGCMMYNLL
jgi:hypothetical protein